MKFTVNRFTISIILIALSSILLVLFNYSGLIDSVIFITFLISIIGFVFSREEMPKAKLNHPQIHQYYKSRINIYGNSMAALIAVIALLYSILTINTKIRTGLICLIVWIIFVSLAYFIALKSQKTLLVNRISDFILLNLNPKEAEIISKNIDRYVDSLLNNKPSNIQIDPIIENQIKKLYELYILAENKRLNSSEIKAINETEK